MARAAKIVCVILFVFGALAIPAATQAQISVGVAIHVGPPALPVYAQPVCPGVGYIWTPGYWAYGPDGYFWVPGTWVLAPTPGYLWTPGYWGWGGGGYFWHAGYWGPHVGFYGGINYGFGYSGSGFYGGEWRGGVYHYNTAVTNVNTTIVHNTYNNTVTNNNTTVNRVSYNGGTGGVTAQPTAVEQTVERERHAPPTVLQTQHQQAASSNRSLLVSENHGQPVVAASAKPGVFKGPGVVPARPVSENMANANANHPGTNGGKAAAMQNDRPPSARTNTAATENATGHTNGNPNRPNSTEMNHAHSANGQMNTAHPNTMPNNTAHTNTAHPNASHPNNPNQNAPHPHAEHPPQQSHPQEQHPGGGHPGGRGR